MKRVTGNFFAKLSLIIFLFLSSPAFAKTIQVTSDQDPVASTPGTLRYSINKASNRDTIKFASHITSITLAQGEILIEADLAVKGQGVTLNGDHSSRIFRINKGKKILLEGLNLVNGNPKDSHGGGAILNYGTLTLKNSILSGNKADSGEKMGGAIYNEGKLAIDNCVLMGNYSAGTGGALFTFVGTVTIKNSQLIGNKAYSDGGAIENRGENKLFIESSNFSDNTAEKAEGGAILNNRGTVSVNNSTFIRNSSGQNGGAIWNNEYSSLIVKNSTFTGNTANPEEHGGAIYNRKGGELSQSNSIFLLNTPDNVFEE